MLQHQPYAPAPIPPPPSHKDKLTDRQEESRTYKGSSPLEIYKYKGAKVPPQSFH